MGNTVGSTSTNFCNFFSNEKDAYILGLWCADGYWWSSSIGLSNIDSDLIGIFQRFLKRHFPEDRIRFNRNHLFVNSRPLLREFILSKKKLDGLKNAGAVRAYFAGRFDGESAKTFCLYISRYEVEKFLNNILPYSAKLQKLVLVPRRDLTLARAKRVK